MLPVTFSPPGTEYVPSAEDSLRDGIWLMFRADDVTRKDMSFDDADEAKGVRIYAGPEAATLGEGDTRRIVLPQMIITDAFASNRWTYMVGEGGEKEIVVAISLLESRDSSYYDTDVVAFQARANAKFRRFEIVLQHGTIVDPDQTRFSAAVIDPYNSGELLENGRYNPETVSYLNRLAPQISRQVSLLGADAVAYTMFARYVVDVRNRNTMEAGYS